MLELVKEIYSPSKAYKVEIYKRLRDGLLEIDVYFWDSEWETWLQKSTSFSLTDNLNSAMAIANEKLKVYSGEIIEVICEPFHIS
ncbi:hypothetical protein SAMN05444673_3080 [Bacillus sp. OV166]|uniref:hypothetical protein n=1 Tax=Bacillus sp. OV166 TaxID=1882763 RepID=UPI000A2AB3B5|nr:hypothetical protein [Bacillus sp. OV166]SMQ77805.1 hypothetical protein SAMN05444673_3080 [Bacillus sp. OV166]